MTNGHHRDTLRTKQDLREGWKIYTVPWGQAQHRKVEGREVRRPVEPKQEAELSHTRSYTVCAGSGEAEAQVRQ